jgi:hypothetical protein
VIKIQEAYKLARENDNLSNVYLGNFFGSIGVEGTIPTVPIRVNPTLKFDSSHHALVKTLVLYTPNSPSQGEKLVLVAQVGCDGIFVIVLANLIQIN